jgi:hypothetical protein
MFIVQVIFGLLYELIEAAPTLGIFPVLTSQKHLTHETPVPTALKCRSLKPTIAREQVGRFQAPHESLQCQAHIMTAAHFSTTDYSTVEYCSPNLTRVINHLLSCLSCSKRFRATAWFVADDHEVCVVSRIEFDII